MTAKENGSKKRKENDLKMGKSRAAVNRMQKVHEVQSFVQGLCCGKTIGKEEVDQMVETVHSKRNREEGVFHIPNQPCKRTKYNYKTLAAKVASITLTTKAIDKTQVREVVEKSF